MQSWGSYLLFWNRHRRVTTGTVQTANNSVMCHDRVSDNLRNCFIFLAFKKLHNLNINKNDKVIIGSTEIDIKCSFSITNGTIH